MQNKLLIGLIIGLAVLFTPSCSSLSVETDKVSVETGDNKVELEGIKIEAKSKEGEPK